MPSPARPTVALAHDVAGPADGPVVLLVHSIGTDRSLWSAQVEPLVAAGLRVVVPDVRGHGDSPVPDGPYAIADLGADLVALLDTLAVGRASVVGLSIGGMAALWMAAHAPARVERLVACCTSPKLGPIDMWTERAAIARAQGTAALSDAVLERWLTEATRAARPDLVEEVRAMLARTPGEGYAGCAEAIAAMDLTGDLGRIAAPTLVLAGAEDTATPAQGHGDVIASAIAGARLELVPGAAHLAPLERPEDVTPRLVSHLT